MSSALGWVDNNFHYTFGWVYLLSHHFDLQLTIYIICLPCFSMECTSSPQLGWTLFSLGCPERLFLCGAIEFYAIACLISKKIGHKMPWGAAYRAKMSLVMKPFWLFCNIFVFLCGMKMATFKNICAHRLHCSLIRRRPGLKYRQCVDVWALCNYAFDGVCLALSLTLSVWCSWAR